VKWEGGDSNFSRLTLTGGKKEACFRQRNKKAAKRNERRIGKVWGKEMLGFPENCQKQVRGGNGAAQNTRNERTGKRYLNRKKTRKKNIVFFRLGGKRGQEESNLEKDKPISKKRTSAKGPQKKTGTGAKKDLKPGGPGTKKK